MEEDGIGIGHGLQGQGGQARKARLVPAVAAGNDGVDQASGDPGALFYKESRSDKQQPGARGCLPDRFHRMEQHRLSTQLQELFGPTRSDASAKAAAQ